MPLLCQKRSMSAAGRFPPPRPLEDSDAFFIMRDHNGQAFAYVYIEDESGQRPVAKLPTKDEMRLIAANVGKR